MALAGVRVLGAIENHDLALQAMLRRNRLGYRLQRVNVPSTPANHLTNFRRNRGNLDHHSPFTRDSYHLHELWSIHQRHDNPLDELQNGCLRCILLCTQRAFLPCEIPETHHDSEVVGGLRSIPSPGRIRPVTA